MASAPDNSFLLSDQDTNQFWCKRGLNLRSLIQPSETLPVELTGTHHTFSSLGGVSVTISVEFGLNLMAHKI